MHKLRKGDSDATGGIASMTQMGKIEKDGGTPQPAGAGGDIPAYRFSKLLASLAHPGSVSAESIGALRTHILAQHMRGGRRSLAICAPSAGVGCSYLASSLAVAMSQAGVKTLLIDANMREPGVSSYIQPESEAPGLLQCLGEDAINFGDAIRAEVLPGLSVMYSGGTTNQPQELLASPEFKSLVDVCLRDFDLTIVDTPPANICADGRSIAAVLRYAMVVAKRDSTLVSDVRQVVDDLRADKVNVIGTFLNDF